MKLMVFTFPLSYNMTIAGTSQIPCSKLQGMKLSRHSPNGCAHTSAWFIVREKKNRRLHYELRTKLTIFKEAG